MIGWLGTSVHVRNDIKAHFYQALWIAKAYTTTMLKIFALNA